MERNKKKDGRPFGRPDFTMDFKTLLSNGATLAPEVLLTPDGVKRGMAVKFDGSRIVGLGPLADFPEATLLPGRAIVTGMVDAHTHVGQIFGKALIGAEPTWV